MVKFSKYDKNVFMTKLIAVLIGLIGAFYLVTLGLSLLMPPSSVARCSGALLLAVAWLFLIMYRLYSWEFGILLKSTIVIFHFAPAFTGMTLLVQGSLGLAGLLPLMAGLGVLMHVQWLSIIDIKTIGYFILPTIVGFRLGSFGLTALLSDSWITFLCGGIGGLILMAMYCGVVQHLCTWRTRHFEIPPC